MVLYCLVFLAGAFFGAAGVLVIGAVMAGGRDGLEEYQEYVGKREGRRGANGSG